MALRHLPGHALDGGGVDGLVGGGRGEGLPRHLEDDPARLSHDPARQAPMTTCAKDTMRPIRAWRRSSASRPGRRTGRAGTRSLNHPFIRPSTILARAASGLPSLRVISSSGGPLRGHLGLGHLVAAEVGRLGEGDVDGDVVGQLLGAALEHDGDGVDPPTGLLVQVGVDHLAGCGHQAAHPARPRCSPSAWCAAGRPRRRARSAASSPLAATSAASSSARATNSAALATKSVSQRSSTMAAASPARTTATAPSEASRSLRLAAPARPFSRSIRAASSRSPSVSSSAFLPSSIPAPVIWRSAARPWRCIQARSGLLDRLWGAPVHPGSGRDDADGDRAVVGRGRPGPSDAGARR